MIHPSLEALPRVLIRAASLLVPGADRHEWTAEWSSELWHAQHGSEVGPGIPGAGITGTRAAILFSVGAVQDAFCLRVQTLRQDAANTYRAGSAARCGLILNLACSVGIVAFLALPGTRNTILPLPYRDAETLAVISSNGDTGMQAPSIRLADYQEWTSDTAGLFSQIAFYQPVAVHLHLTNRRTAALSLAIASGNLLEMLGINQSPIHAASTPALPRLVLSRSAWRRFYRADPSIVGHTARVAGQTVEIAGILPDSAWRLPGHVDGWLLEDPHGLEILPPTVRGFVVARIRSEAFPPPHAGWRSMEETRYGVESKYECGSLSFIAERPLLAFSCCLLLALLALPAITALSLGDYPLSREPLHRSLVARRWLFLAAKLLLTPAIAYFWTADLAFGSGVLSLSDASAVQAFASFLALLFGFRWVLQDQRRRCPVCLRLLSNPARVGQASCNFLGWSGIELICASGHGLLHIPELPTSWFDTQRWLCLDPSWLCLFSDPADTTPANVA
ncbi:MAG TPA: hypothetical protein VHX60_00085 [Acidobacteriaceae bacterium]|jgi:hypothetical protein|nr:hypothetical protein [Acidobacteriaceae bacterium]